ADLLLKPGMTANITVTVDRRDDVLSVPNTALRYTPPATTQPSPDGAPLTTGMPAALAADARGGAGAARGGFDPSFAAGERGARNAAGAAAAPERPQSITETASAQTLGQLWD